MYFQSADSLHIILVLIFFSVTLGIVFFRLKKNTPLQEKSVNYTSKKTLQNIRITSLVLSLAFLCIAFLEPVGLMKTPGTQAEGADCIWLLDVSKSMDARDMDEGASRLERAKAFIEEYSIAHPNNRYGLVIFAGTTRLVSPLTSDYSSLLTFLSSIDSKSIREGGTNFSEALKLSLERFDTTEQTPHVIVLLSDGGDEEDLPDTASLRNIFTKENTFLVSLGMGGTDPVPLSVGKNPFGETVYKKYEGELVLTSLQRENLKELAKQGNGIYSEGDSIGKDLENFLRKNSSKIAREL